MIEKPEEKQIECMARELAYLIAKLPLKEEENDMLIRLVASYVELNRDEAWDSCIRYTEMKYETVVPYMSN